MKKVPRLGEAWMALSIACAAVFAYYPALTGRFLWDDDRHVTGPQLQTVHGLWRIWFDLGATQQYYPLLHSAFWIEHGLWGDTVLGYHLANVTFHTMAAILVVLIVRRLSLPGAWLAGLIFALHPVCVESVAWISEQKNTLSAVFYLSAAYFYLDFDKTRRTRLYWLATFLFVLALLTKTVTATLPAALLVVFWWQRGTLHWKKDAAPLLPWFGIGAGAGVFTAWVERKFIGAEGANFALTLGQKCLLAPRIIWFYFAKLIWPSDLIFVYPRWTVDAAAWWQYMFPVGIVIVAAALIFLARQQRGPMAGFLFFAGTLFPVLGFVNIYPFVYSYVADHFDYLASLGIIVPAAVGITLIPMRPVAPILAAAVVGVLWILSWNQCSMYVDAETLYRETLARNPECWFAANNLGAQLLDSSGGLPEAIRLLDTSVRLKPGYPQAHNNLGMAFSRLPGRLPEAIREFEAAVRIQPNYLQARNNLGVALLRTSRTAEAVSQFQAALRIDPNYAEAHNNLGNALALDHADAAIVEYRAALRLNPDYAEVHYDLANTLSDMAGRSEEAIAEYQAALRARPDYPEARNNLGLLFARLPNRLPDAIAEFRAAVQLQPSFAEAHLNLAMALSRSPRGVAEAIAESETALRIRPDFMRARQMVDRLRASQR
jgi:tetratricopeptide (TPR) repeat protein